MEDKLCHDNGGVVPGSLKNLNSSLAGFLEDRGLDHEYQIGTELSDSFYKILNQHLESMRSKGRKDQNIRDRKSHLRAFRSLYLQLKKAHSTEKTPFQEALDKRISGLSLKKLASQSGVSVSSLKRWLAGSIPTHRSLPTLRRLERFLALPAGALVDLLANSSHRKAQDEGEDAIAFRQNLAKRVKQPYRLKAIPEQLRKEWMEFVTYKTAPILFGILRSRTGQWTPSRQTPTESKKKRWYALTQSGEFIPTADIAWERVVLFFGWMENIELKPAGLDHSLAQFADLECVQRYLQWTIQRSNNKIHGGHVSLVNFILSLVHPVTGYLTQKPELRAALDNDMSAEDWTNSCEKTFRALKAVKSDLSKSATRARDPNEPVKHVISLDNPLVAMQDMVARMKADRPTPGTSQEAIWSRDLVTIRLLMCSPLRLGNIRDLTYRADNSGNLYKSGDDWSLRIDAEVFKNRNGAAKGQTYDITLDPSIRADLERYLKIHRPQLLRGRKANDFLFVSSDTNIDGPWENMGRRIQTLTKRYLMRCPGVGPHVVRHIIATAIVKQSGDFTTAALVLHDREDTVRKNYSHLRPEDGHRKYHSMFNKQFSS